jgi:hypothetical protein
MGYHTNISYNFLVFFHHYFTVTYILYLGDILRNKAQVLLFKIYYFKSFRPPHTRIYFRNLVPSNVMTYSYTQYDYRMEAWMLWRNFRIVIICSIFFIN